MFEMSVNEFDNWRSQFVTSNQDKQGLRHAPFCFTEQGVAMLSSVLKTKQAIQINILIMRMFTKMRQFLNDYSHIHMELTEVKLAVEKLARKQDGHDKNIDLIFTYIDSLEDKLEQPPLSERDKIGYKVGTEKD